MQANVFQATGLQNGRRIPTSLTVWVGLNALDALLTFYLLGAGGVEANPMLAAMQSELGAAGMLLMKVGIALLAGIALLTIKRPALLHLASKLMAVVVAYNAIIAISTLFPRATMPFVS
jgi:hypothetical protein